MVFFLNISWHWKVGEEMPALILKKRRMKYFVAVLTVVYLVLSPLAPVWAATSYPEPKGNVNDYANVLGEEDLREIESLIGSVLAQTEATFAVAIFDDLEGESVPMYAANLFEAWGIGEAGEDRGLLLLVALAEREARIEVGYGLEQAVTDSMAGRCLDLLSPYFQDGDYGKGVYAALYLAAEYVAKDKGVDFVVSDEGQYHELPQKEHEQPLLFTGIIMGVLGLLLGSVSYLAIRGRRCPRCKAKLSVVDKVVKEATVTQGGVATRIYHCNQCGYHKEETYKTGPKGRPPGAAGGIGRGPGPFIGGGMGGSSRGSGSIGGGPRGFGGGRSGGGGAGRKW